MSAVVARQDASNLVAYVSGSTWGTAAPPSHREQRSSAGTRLNLAERALQLLTDLRWERAIPIAADRTVEDARWEMHLAGVGVLLVVEGDMVVGLVSRDRIEGECASPRVSGSVDRIHARNEVGEIMTPWEDVRTIDWQVVRSARVADLIKLFRRTQEKLVVALEYVEQGGIFVRGIISRARRERGLGRPLAFDVPSSAPGRGVY